MMRARLHRLIYSARMMSWLVDPRRLLTMPEYPIDRPIFLLGMQGGGLTLLSRMLRRHPNVISAGGGHRYWTSADELQNVYGPILPAELTGLRYKAPPHPQWQAPRSWTYAINDLLPAYRRGADAATPSLRDSLKRVIRLSARRHATDPGQCRFVDKSQVFTVRAGLIHQLLRDEAPRFVLVPRDPYVSVFRAASGKAADMKRMADQIPIARRIELCAEHYGNAMRAVLEDRDSLGFPLHIIPFEELVANPEPRLREVCEFAELAFNADMLPAAHHRLPIGTRFLDRWFPVRADVNLPYEGRIDGQTVDAVNQHCGDILGQIGYPRRHPQDVAHAA